MPLRFQLKSRLGGFAATFAKPGEGVQVICRELIPPASATLFQERIDQLQRALFDQIPGLPRPSQIEHVLVVIAQDLSAEAYVNELGITASVRPTRPVVAGEPLVANDIDRVYSVDLGVEVPEDAAFVLVRSREWRRSLLYDFGPLQPELGSRSYPLDAALAAQELALLGIETEEYPPGVQLDRMKAGLLELENLLQGGCEEESEYQDLLTANPWMFGGEYDLLESHRKLDDERIPDFTARRCFDGCRDIIEIKQPFLKLFKKKGNFAADFNDSWNQAEEYRDFSVRQRHYLLEEKDLNFDNPRAFLVMGFNLGDRERKSIRHKEARVGYMHCRTYDELLLTARNMVALMESAAQRLTVDF